MVFLFANLRDCSTAFENGESDRRLSRERQLYSVKRIRRQHKVCVITTMAVNIQINGRKLRQNLQHYLWKDGVGYLLHPSIPTHMDDLRVAEIGVGTGCGTFNLRW